MLPGHDIVRIRYYTALATASIGRIAKKKMKRALPVIRRLVAA